MGGVSEIISESAEMCYDRKIRRGGDRVHEESLSRKGAGTRKEEIMKDEEGRRIGEKK